MSPSNLHRLQRNSLVLGASAMALLLLGALFRPEQFFRSYLFGYLPWVGLSLGALAILMIHHLAAGHWGHVIRRFLEAATQNLPMLALLFLPIVLGVSSLYEWARPEPAAMPRLLGGRGYYLNAPFFFIRSGLYFIVWYLLAARLNRLSDRQERDGRALSELQHTSGPGLVLCAITITFAAIDWAMSLEFHWSSTIYGVSFITGQCLSALVFCAVALQAFSGSGPLERAVRPSHFHDLGNMILAFVMLWAYMAFSQYLIIWSGNLPEGIEWYQHRSGGWRPLVLLLIAFHFAAPLLLLLSREAKNSGRMLAGIAGFLFFMRFLDNFWLVAPAFHPDGFHLDWMDLAAPIGIGGLWLAAFLRHLERRPLLATGDPRFEELAHGVS